MIQNAKNILLTNINSALPNMSNTITGWFLDITFKYVTRTLNGAYWEESAESFIQTKGVVQPPRDEDLKILPDGTWNWEWLMMHCLPDVQLEVNNFIVYDGVKYKIMARKNFEKYGYIRYMLLEATQAS